MNLRKTILSSLLLAIGLVLHQLVPPFLFGMKPDFLLSMMFIAIILSDDYRLTIIIGLAAGILTAATTTFPGGQIPNIIDKFITCNIAYFMLKLLKNTVNNQIKIVIISLIGTLASGGVFLGAAFILVGLPGSFLALVIAVVLPAALFNMITSMILYKISYSASKNITF
ncbi:tryptophan transporter [Clostridium sp. YIM B02515]|uniref:Tryptophan transporter n=1 Tax=Clostridium rhizosphaerae TaxID=2803861 RepID=A0ABS1TH74_9CLOT|nr:tryptophan transporter [Clostridium rhizosphaerae]MBL4938675.1 tryptophan transporter [Clostridium rhizosphaerae]